MKAATLTGITWDHPRGYAPLEAASMIYHRQFGVKVDWIRRSLKDFGDQSLTDLAEQFDLLVMDHPHCGVAAKSKCLIPLDDFMRSDDLELLGRQSAGPSFNSYRYKDHQWALPVDAAFQSASCRKDLFSCGLPANWEDVFALSERLKTVGKYVGMALCPTDSLCTFLSLTAQFGVPIKEESDQLIEEEIGGKIFDLMCRMRDHFHPNSLNWNPIQLYDYMAEVDDIVYCPLAFNYTNYSRAGFRKNELTFIDPPNQVGVLGGAGIAVSKSCQHPLDAIQYASWVCGDEVQKGTYTQAEGQPGNFAAWEDDNSNNLTGQFFRNTRKTLENAYVRPRFNQWPEFQEWLGEQLHDHLVHGKPGDELIELININYQKMSKN